MDIRKMLERMVRELGHEPVLPRGSGGRVPEHFAGIDVYILEMAGSLGIVLAQGASQAEEPPPIIGIGDGRPPTDELALLGIKLAAWLSKPFTLPQLREAIERALER